MNAKDELMHFINKYEIVLKGFKGIKILLPNGTYEPFYLDTYNDLLKFLDREYNDIVQNGHLSLYGTLYGYSKDIPIWLTRENFEGLEGWDVNRLPEFFFNNSQSPNKLSVTPLKY